MPTTVSVTVNEQRIINGSLLNQAAYNIPLFVRFGQGLDIRRMYSLLAERFERLAIFRTSFSVDGAITKRISDEAPLVEIQSFARLDKSEKEQLLARCLISIEDAELVRAVLCKVTGERADYLFLNVHHALLDGFSMNLFLQDLLAAYLRDEPCSLEYEQPAAKEAEVSITSVQHRSAAEAHRFDGYDGFKAKLLGKQTEAVRYLEESLALPDCPSRIGSDFALCMTAFALGMAQWLGTYDVYAAYPSLGRDLNSYRQLGSFVQMIPFDLRLEPEQPVEALVGAVQKRTLANLGTRDHYNEMMGLERMQLLNLFRDVIFDYKSGTLIDKLLDEAHDITLEEAEAYRDEKYGLHFSVYKNGQVLQLSIISSEYAEEELHELIGLFRRNVDVLYRQPKAAVGEMVRFEKAASANEDEPAATTAARATASADQTAAERLKFAAREAEPAAAVTVQPEGPAIDQPPVPPAGQASSRADRQASICADVMSIVSAMLEGEPVKPNESFFDIGMDSTLLVKFKKRVRDRFGANLKISDFFNHYTSELLSAHIMNHLKEDH